MSEKVKPKSCKYLPPGIDCDKCRADSDYQPCEKVKPMRTEMIGARQVTVQPPHCPICNASTLRFPYYVMFKGMTTPTQICKSCYRIIGCIEYMKIRGAYELVEASE